jgi:hypothetical protein
MHNLHRSAIAGLAIAVLALCLPTMPATGAMRSPVTAKGWHLVQTISEGSSFVSLQDLVALSPKDAWVVGSYGSSPRSHALTARWNGRSWSKVRVADSQVKAIDVVAMSSRGDTWAFGYGANGQYLLNWTGRTWSVQRATGASNILVSAAIVFNRHDVWIFGSNLVPGYGSYAVHFNGHAWKAMPIPGISAEGFPVAAAAATSPRSIWVASNEYPATSRILHWNGRWSVAALPSRVAHMRYLEFAGLASAPSGSVWASGWQNGPSDPGGFAPVLLQLHRSTWRYLPVGPCYGCQTAFVAPDGGGGAWAQTNQSFVLHFRGDRWHKVRAPNMNDLTHIPGTTSMWGFSLAGQIYAYGSAGT